MSTNMAKQLQGELNYTNLKKMLRADLEKLAKNKFGIEAHHFQNKSLIVQAILSKKGDKLEEDGLSMHQDKFCRLYATDVEFFGNGVQSYIKAFNVDITNKGAYAASRVEASKLLTKPNVLSRIREYLELAELNDEFVDKEMAFVIAQKNDLGAKMKAINEYNKLKRRIVERDSSINAQIQNNTFNVSINDQQGQDLSKKITDYILEITKAPLSEK